LYEYSIKNCVMYSASAGVIFSACGNGGGGNNSILMLLGGGTKVNVPSAPDVVLVTPADKQLSLSWAAVAGATAYEVWINDENNSTTATQDGGDITDTIYNITGLINGTTYFVWLKAKNAIGTSGFGIVSSGTPVKTPGAATITPGDTELSLNWTAVDGATAYEVWVNDKNDSTTAIQDGGEITDTIYNIQGLINGTTYYVWLKAKYVTGSSGFGTYAYGTPLWVAGFKETFSAGGVTFKMVFVPGGYTFPTGTDNEGSDTIDDAYWIGETEVTYELWSTVYEWAVNGTGSAIGEGAYTFANQGIMGDGTGDTNQHPVTTINWRSAMAWCNALTEWYNAKKGTSYSCVYYMNSDYITPIRTVDDSTDWGVQDAPYVKSDANGFRLLASNEWELAARYINGTNWLYGDHASGDSSGACFNDGSILGGQSLSTVFGNYGVYNSNSSSSTAIVKSKTAGYNFLGLYDMSGNIYEWCFDLYPGFGGSSRIYRGGSWNNDAERLQVGDVRGLTKFGEANYVGFRFSRTQ
jgi:formylglycine-generating enzyme required for sulfatase activity